MAQTPDTGTLIAGRYLLAEEIGHGGMARVFRATDEELERSVAVKLLREPLVEYAERFEREARAMGRLQHPAVVKVFGYGVSHEGLPYLVLEFVGKAVGLHAVIAERKRISALETASLMLPIAGALAEAHGHGIVHRDLKPDNILVQHAAGMPPQLRLIDFGIAAWDEPTAQRLTKTGQVFGTPTYMAPEHASGEFGADAQADVWALGVVLYEMVSGENPFRGPHVTATLFNIINKEPPPLEGVPPDFQALVNDCLSKERDARPPDAGAVLERLQAIVDQAIGPELVAGISALGGAMTVEMSASDGAMPAPAVDVPTPTAALVHRPPPGREQRARLAIAVASAVGGLILGLVLGLSRTSEPSAVESPGPDPVVAAEPGATNEPPAEPAEPIAEPTDTPVADPEPARNGLVDPALVVLEAFVEAGEGERIQSWLEANPDTGGPDARKRLEGLALLAAGKPKAGLEVLDELMTRRPELAQDAATQRMVLGTIDERAAGASVSLLALMARADVAVMKQVMDLTDDDDYRTRKRAVAIIDKAGGDVDRADFRFYVRNLRVTDCDLRKLAVENLMAIGDPAAVGPLKRMQSMYGFFDSMCMGGVDDDAIHKLSRMPPRKKVETPK